MIPFPDKKYQIIYADPPWKFDKSITDTFACKYPCMDINELKELKIKTIKQDDCALFLWTTMRHIPQAIILINEWGFEYRTCAFVWVKTSRKGNVNHRLGYWTLSNAEICLLGISGHPKKMNNKVKSVYLLNREGHSKKPKVFRDKIVTLFGDIPRIELFARPPKDLLFKDESYKGWDLWGNEV